jgi:hypothetical protein
MDTKTLFLAAIVIVFGITFVGFFATKSEGWGRYTTAVLLLLLVLFISFVTFSQGMIEGAHFVNLLVAVAGFAGGLPTAKEA